MAANELGMQRAKGKLAPNARHAIHHVIRPKLGAN